MQVVKPDVIVGWKTRPDQLDVVPTAGDGIGLLVNCTTTDPPSSRGKKVVVWFPSELLPQLIKEAKAAAIRDRNKSLVDE